MTTQSDSDLSAALAALDVAHPPPSFYNVAFAQDKGEGTSGERIHARVNYFKIDTLAFDHVHVYSISFAPVAGRDVKNAALKKQIIVRLLEEGKMYSLAGSLATDYSGTLVALTDELPKELSVTRQLKNSDGSLTTFTIILDRTYTLHRQELETYRLGKGQTNISPWITALNILARDHALLNTVRVGAERMFNETKLGDLPLGLHARSGFFNSVRPVLAGEVMNMHRVCAAFLDVQPLLQYVTKHLARPLSQVHDLRFKATAFGLRVQLLYTPPTKANPARSRILNKADPNSRVRRIGGFGSSAATQMFNHDIYGSISVKTYFEKYVLAADSRLAYPNLLVCDLGPRDRPIYVPPELLSIAPDHVFPGKLPETVMSDMLRYAQHTPVANVDFIEGAFRSNGMFDIGKSNHIKIASPTMMETPARVLPAPDLQYASAKKLGPRELKNGRWNLVAKKFRVPGQVGPLGVITVGETKVPDNVVKTTLPRGLSVYGIAVSKCVLQASKTTSRADLSEALRKLSLQNANKYVLIILPSTTADDYANIKWWSDTRAGVHTVCVTPNKSKSLTSPPFLANLALKFNTKSGGRNHYLAEDQVKVLQKAGSTMVLGADVTHPGQAGVRHCPSIAAVVASTDIEAVHFPGTLSLQQSKQETIEDLSTMVASRLQLWRKSNSNQLPKNILIYRDGVSDSQFASVKDVELVKIRQGCRMIGQDYQPQITLIVCGKRHHTRFFPTKEDIKSKAQHVDHNSNFKPGLVVDSKTIRNPYHFDFYLQSHAALKGTARPCHYFVIENGMKLSTDDLQRITFNLCWTFARSTTPISYASPAYCADVLAERGRCYLAPFLNPMHPARPTVDELLAGHEIGPHSTTDAKDKFALQKIKGGWNKDPNSPHWTFQAAHQTQLSVPMHDAVKDSMFYI